MKRYFKQTNNRRRLTEQEKIERAKKEMEKVNSRPIIVKYEIHKIR